MKKYLKIMSLALFVFSVSCIYPTEAAAKFKEGIMYFGEEAFQVGKYYYTEYEGDIYVSQNADNRGSKIIQGKQNEKLQLGHLYYTKKFIYYSYTETSQYTDSKQKIFLYRVKHDGTGRKKIAAFTWKNSEDLISDISLVYQDRYLTYTGWAQFSDNSQTVFIDLKTNKKKTVKGKYYTNFTSHESFYNIKSYEHYKNKYVTWSDGGDICPISHWIYDAKKGTFFEVGNDIWDICIVGKNVYYLEQGESGKIMLMRCDTQGKHKTLMGNKINSYASMFVKVTKKYCVYNVISDTGGKNQYYKYVYSTGKTSKVSWKES